MCACFPIAVLRSIDTHKGELTLHHERARRMCVPVRLAPQLLDRHDDWFACANREQTNKIRRGVATIENGIKCATSLCEAMVVLSLYKKTQIGIYDQGSANEAFFTLTEDRSVKEYSYFCFLLTDMLRNVSEYSTKSLTPLCATMVVLSL